MWKELDVDDWMNEISNAMEYRRLHGLEESWASLEALFYNTHEGSVHEGPNIIAGTGDSLLSSLNVPNPHIMVKARRRSNPEAIRILESVDNELLQDLDVGSEVETASLHAYLWGRGTLKIGYDSEFGWDPDLEFQEGTGISLSQFNKKGSRLEFDSLVRPGMPWVKAVLPHDLLVPFGTGVSLERSPWVIHRVVRHIEDVKADSKYENTSSLEPVMSMEDYVKSYQTVTKPYRAGETVGGQLRRSNEGKAEFVEMFEIRDKRSGKILVVATGHKKFLRNDEDALQTHGVPFVSFTLTPSARCFWTTPDAFYLKQAQAELSDISIQTTKQRRLSVLKFLFKEGAMDVDDLEKLLSIEVGSGIKVKQGNTIAESIQTITAPNNNQLLYMDSEYVRRNAREAVGFSRNQMGEYEQKGRRTATESLIVGKSSDLRMSRREKIIKEVYKSTFKKINSIIFEFWTLPRWAQILGEDGIEKWVRFRGTDLKGPYAYDVDFSSEPGMSVESRRQQAVQMYAALVQDPMIDPIALRQYLVNAFNDPELAGLFNQTSRSPANANVSAQVPGGPGGGGGSAGGPQPAG